ncbi:uncharacterized protein LOC34620809 [Cyclospora cayetanensis]|uniref:Uncharacterized protein LOC34620809 n=1 Tax=Cyclospora cayetanensis TaxID=88456 RepID=A0A6P6S3T1_9EIME|nr:uncharacterized protein LOC34620809 [Cyclospora cayetanensis]
MDRWPALLATPGLAFACFAIAEEGLRGSIEGAVAGGTAHSCEWTTPWAGISSETINWNYSMNSGCLYVGWLGEGLSAEDGAAVQEAAATGAAAALREQPLLPPCLQPGGYPAHQRRLGSRPAARRVARGRHLAASRCAASRETFSPVDWQQSQTRAPACLPAASASRRGVSEKAAFRRAPPVTALDALADGSAADSSRKRKLYGWFISSRVSVAPCVVPPTLPSSLLLTPLTFAQSAACFPPEHSVSEEDAGAGRPHDPSKKNRLSSTSLGRLLRAALLQSEDGRSRLLDAFLDGLDVQTAGRAEAASVSPSVQKDHHLPPADEVCNAPPSKTQDLPEAPAPAAFCSLLGLPLWNGALVRLALHLSSDEVARLLHSHSALQQREPEKPHAELAARATIPAKERAEDGAETSEEASTESRPSAFLLTRELRELEDGLGDLYVASSDTGSGGEGGAAEDPRSSSPEHPCARPSLPAASGGSPGAQLQEPLEWAKVAAHCSVVEESGIETFRGLPRVRAAGGSYRKVGAWISSESPGETVAGPRTADATGGWSSPPAAAEETPAEGSSPMHHVALDVLVSFSSADTQEGLATSPSAQRNGAASAHMKAAPPHFSRSLPPVFAPLCHHGGDGQMREEDAGPHSEDDACVLLNDALRGLVRQGALRAAVTEPLRVLVGSAGSSDSCGDLRLPLRHGGASCETFGEALPRRLRGEHQTSRSVPSPAGPKANDASGRDGTGAVRLKCSQLVIDPEAFRAAQRLWWLLPPTLSARLSAADAYTPSDSASGFEARLLRLLQQGCVETPAAELPLCSCGGQRGCATPIDFLLHLSSVVSRPLLADFQGLKAFGNCPDALKRAVYRRLGQLANPDEDRGDGASDSRVSPSCSKTFLETDAAESRASRALSALGSATLLVCGPRGSGRSALCRAICVDVMRRLGVFTMIVHCRLLAREAMPSVLIRHVLSAAFEVAEANSPSLLLLEDLDVLCLSGEDGGNLPTVAHARGTAIAAFLCDLINGVSEAASAAGSCRLDGLGGQHGVRTSSRRVLTLATSVNLSSLHPLLARPSLFGSSKVEVNCDTSMASARLELLRALVGLSAATTERGIPLSPPQAVHPASNHLLPVGDARAVTTDAGSLRDIANQLEGYSLADFQAVVSRAVGESLLGYPLKVSEALTSPYDAEKPPLAFIQAAHLRKALADVRPRATQTHAFIQPNLRYCHVGGLHKPKEDLHDLLTLQRRYPLLLRASGIAVHQGVLLIGPPGCGKTHLALAAVGEAGIRCIHIKGPELLGKFIGSSEAAVRDVFQRAKAAKPCAILFDEIEALATKRGADTTGVTDRVVNQLLCYLDGIEAREDVFVIATTARPDLVDSALLRPGRFDKVCFCGLPQSDAERQEILAVALKSLNSNIVLDTTNLASMVPPAFTPADIQAAVKQAQLYAVQEALAACTGAMPYASSDGDAPDHAAVTKRHLTAAIENAKPSLSIQELQRYHRYCLPIVNKACHESIRVLENVLLHSSQENRSKGHSVFNMEKLTDKKKPTAESPTLECVQSPMRPPGSTQCLHESESNSEADLEEAFKSGEVILSPTLPPSPGSATVSPRIGTFNGDRHDPSIIPELDASMCKIKALGDGNKLERGEADRSCNNGLPAEKKRKRKKLPAQLAGNRVALA